MPADLLSLSADKARYERHSAGLLHLDRFPDSIDTLAPNNHFVRALNLVSIKSGIPYHRLGDRDENLPANHGFDEFYGNLYHLSDTTAK